MRKKELKLIITFHTTAEAIAMEKACREDGVPGRLIPVPRQISSGCGLSWSTAPGSEDQVRTWMEDRSLEWEAMGEYVI